MHGVQEKACADGRAVGRRAVFRGAGAKRNGRVSRRRSRRRRRSRSRHILANENVLDGFGHVSIRDPRNPNRYLMSRSVAPATVTADDIMEYDLDSKPVDAKGRGSYKERFIHGEIYKVRPDVNAVIHSHSPTIVPFSLPKY